MKKQKPFFYKLNAADFFAIIREFSDKELAKWIRTFSADLVAGNSKDEFTSRMIEETVKYRESLSQSGKIGMEKRWKNG